MFRISIFLMAMVLTACRTPPHTTDLRGESNECELHHAAMRSARVLAGIGCVLPRTGFLEARNQSFPHSYPRWLESRKDFCIVYVCDACIQKEDEWSKSH
jgi:hypothetical protein